MPEDKKDDNDSGKEEEKSEKDNGKEEEKSEKDNNKESDGTDGDHNNDSSNHQIKQLRKESAKKRIEIKKLRDKLEDAEAKIAAANDKSDDDKDANKATKKEVDILREVNKRYIRAELKAVALKAGLIDVDALKMFDTSSIEIDANGDVVGVKELIEEMKELKPYAFSTTAKDTTTDKKTPGSSKVNSKNALDMSNDEFAKTSEKLGLRVNSWS